MLLRNWEDSLAAVSFFLFVTVLLIRLTFFGRKVH